MALDPAEIRALCAENPKARARDLAESHGLPEAALLAAHLGQGVTAIDPAPDRLIPRIAALGDVMALTRNASCVHERRGVYDGYHGGAHAQMVVGPEIDLRIFPKHWAQAFAVETTGQDGRKCSLQVFDATGDAVHKIHLSPASDVAAYDHLVAALRLTDQRHSLTWAPRAMPEPAKGDPGRADTLRREWQAMTDTHQFLAMTSRLKMNRLGAYRTIGAPQVRAIAPTAVTEALHGAAAAAIPVMIFVGNAGCIQIHGGLIEKIVPMGPWINVMDPRFNLHLRTDHFAEAYCVTKPTKRGPAISLEAFDKDGGLIVQIFGYRKEVSTDAWDALANGLAAQAEVMA